MLSIVVPVYNVKEYLDECLLSILNQTFTDLEIILVDDGSTDGSSSICDSYAEKDRRIRVIHQPNKGLSGARNTGLQHIHGEWAAFVDSDDFLEPHMYERMLREAEKSKADLVVCGVQTFYIEDGKKKVKGQLPATDIFSVCDEKEYWIIYDQKGSMTCDVVWNKLYRRNLLEGIEFPEGKYCEDVFVMHHILSKCGRICMLPDCFYWYRLRADSIMHEKFSTRHLAVVEALLLRSEYFRQRSMKVQQRIVLRSAVYHLANAYGKLDWKEKGSREYYSVLRRQCIQEGLSMMPGADLKFYFSFVPFLLGQKTYMALLKMRNKVKKLHGRD